jgi:hypothetical protein
VILATPPQDVDQSTSQSRGATAAANLPNAKIDEPSVMAVSGLPYAECNALKSTQPQEGATWQNA